MKKKSKIGIVVLHYGKSSVTNDCIESILQSDCKDFQILVIDNFSPEPFQAKKKFLQSISILKNHSNTGYSGGMNFGLRAFQEKSEVDYFFLLNNDVKLLQTSISNLKKSASQKIGIFAPLILDKNSHPSEFGGTLNSFTMFFRDLSVIPKVDQKVEYVTGAALFFSKETFAKIGFLDERFFMYSEDMDFCIRANKLQIPLVIVPSAKIIHLKGVASGGVSPFSTYYIHRNRILLAKKFLNFFLFTNFIIFYSCVITLKIILWFFKRKELCKWFFLGLIDGILGRDGKSKRFS